MVVPLAGDAELKVGAIGVEATVHEAIVTHAVALHP
jgi:hypothetical protein